MKKNPFKNRFRILVGTVATTAILLTGCGSSTKDYVFTGTAPIIVPQPPVAVNDTFNALGNANVSYSAANGVLVNDTVNGATISAFDSIGDHGGTLVLNADGSFTYTPVFGFVGAETFSYTLSNSDGSSTADITLTSTGEGFFVNNTVGAGGNGSQATPFDTLASAVAAAGAGDTIFVARGDGTNTGLAGNFTLPAGVDLIGEGEGLILAQTIVPQGLAPVITGVVTCGGDNTISGIIFDGENTQDENIVVNAVADVTISNNTFRDVADSYILGNDVSGTLTIDGNTFEPGNSMDEYIGIDNSSVNGNIVITHNTFDDDLIADPDCDGIDIYVDGNSIVDIILSDNKINGSNDGNSFGDGIDLSFRDTSVVTLTVERNNISNTNYDGLYLYATNTSDVTVTMEQNIIEDIGDDGVYISTGGSATLSGRIAGNVISRTSNDGIEVESSGGTMTITNNTIDTTGDDGIDVSFESGGTMIVSNNEVKNAGDYGITYSDSSTTTPALLALRNNTITDSASEAVYLDISGTVSLCAEIVGNIVNKNMLFANTSTGDLKVEQFNNLATVNTFSPGTSPQDPGAGVTSVAIGACAIP